MLGQAEGFPEACSEDLLPRVHSFLGAVLAEPCRTFEQK